MFTLHSVTAFISLAPPLKSEITVTDRNIKIVLLKSKMLICLISLVANKKVPSTSFMWNVSSGFLYFLSGLIFTRELERGVVFQCGF